MEPPKDSISPKRKLREITLQLLYSYDLSQVDLQTMLPMVMGLVPISRKNALTALTLAKNVLQDSASTDSSLEEISQEYSLGRISKVDLNILRLLIYEVEKENMATEIAVSEGVRLSKKFSSHEAAKFVHAMLDRYVREKVNGTSAPV